MNDLSQQSETVLEVVSPDRSRQHVPLTVSPFLIGRGGADNNLQLADGRISWRCAAMVTGENGDSQALGCCHEKPLGELKESVRAFTRGAGQSDDITLLVVRYRPPDGNVRPRENAVAGNWNSKP